MVIQQHTEKEQAQLIAQLARVEGIDDVKALRCMSGQTRLYLKLVKDFAKEQQHRIEDL